MGGSKSKLPEEFQRATVTDVSSGEKYVIAFEPDSFESGTCRNAYKGEIIEPSLKRGQQVVVKLFKNAEGSIGKDNWSEDIDTSTHAKDLANGYNVALQSAGIQGSISFCVPIICKLQKRFLNHSYIVVEPYLNSFKKFGNNLCEDHSYPFLAAFSHWSWQSSGYRYLVCDLQGEEQGSNNYLLTDPAIHSVDRNFGPTDLGIKGMITFMSNHRCNTYCKHLQLVDIEEMKKQFPQDLIAHGFNGTAHTKFFDPMFKTKNFEKDIYQRTINIFNK